MSNSALAIVILAAGQGTRMKSQTPKVLHNLAGLPMIGHVLRTATSLDPAHLVVVVRHEAEAISEVVSALAPTSKIVHQDEIPGTGRALETALSALPADFKGDIAVLSGDVPLLSVELIIRLLKEHVSADASATILSAKVKKPRGYGRIVREGNGDVREIVEESDADDDTKKIDEVNSGTYVFRFQGMRELLEGISTNNAQGEKYLPDVVAAMRSAGSKVNAFATRQLWQVNGVNDRAQLARVAKRLNRTLIKQHQAAGVYFLDPDSVWVDVDVSIGADTQILPGTVLRGATTIAEGATIGPDTTLVDTEVGAGAVVKRTEATLSVIGAGVTVGPWALLRPGTEISEKAKVGTFVEVKNSKIGRGTKVPHLSYIGDAEIGEETNIGAGAITANYDGVKKHKTIIGSRVKTSAHNVFVAPVTIEDDTYTGAGTVVRRDVPKGSLAVNVVTQKNIEGWVAKNRPPSENKEH
ncbi:MAG: bifunctional UDP-N-acetylglucosamine diphosphorylase/glucosamine-1-phosphate N-acetyltransferase GlmU [Microbacteriaceae bacterium]|nr:bifunctional UDP-N-acetylglucosamine diphosphorylase/glucosamine-1-phosphate N-acetyltransferase GlmU [Microbacteriaceae bacterium]